MSRMQMGAPRLDITPFTKQLLIALLALYVLELITYAWLGVPVYSLLGWHPTQEGFRLWQPLTGYFVQGKDPIWFLVELLMVFFFVPPVQKSFGRKGVYRMLVTTIGVATIFASLLIIIGAVSNQRSLYGNRAACHSSVCRVRHESSQCNGKPLFHPASQSDLVGMGFGASGRTLLSGHTRYVIDYVVGRMVGWICLHETSQARRVALAIDSMETPPHAAAHPQVYGARRR